jgi:DNA-binding MarR family transcriptional regulator
VASLERNATELRNLVQDFLQRYREVDAGACSGRHAELSMQELRVIERLGDAGPTRMKELAEYMLLAVNSLTSLIDKLEAQDLVRRERSNEDRRVVFVQLTNAGRLVFRAAVDDKLGLMKLMLGRLTASEQESFMSLFRKIADAGQD